jgi:hypothetical protein
MGIINLSGIALPLRPVIINESNIITDNTSTISVAWAWMYEGVIFPSWNLNIMMSWEPASSRDIWWTNGIFSVDLSLATQYTITITDSNNSKTTDTITVRPGSPSTTLDGGLYYAKDYCNTIGSGTLNCPDTTTLLGDDNRTATVLEQEPPVWPIVANGIHIYQHTMKVRDTYGNRIETGSIKIKYTTTVKHIQTDISENMSLYTLPSNMWDGDAFISSELFSWLGGSVDKNEVLWIADFKYAIASLAPTNITDNIIKLDFINYLSWGVESVLIPTNAPLAFSPLFTASTSSTVVPIIGVANTFSSLVTENGPPTLIKPYIISTLLIGDGTKSEWQTLSSNPTAECTHEPFVPIIPIIDNLCDWESRLSNIATHTGSDFSFLATYTGRVPTPPLETTVLRTYIQYKNGATDILYQLPDTLIDAPLTATQRMRVFGQISEGMWIGSQNRVSIINKLRESTSLLSRNRSDYTGVDYIIYSGNQTITDATFNTTKRTIIVIGGDITIDTNIALRDHPLAIIALTNSTNQWGNIRIKWNITDIHSTLIAEHGLTSEVSVSQLYIHGSIISANPPREVAPSVCPYFDSSCTSRLYYDLPGNRAGYVSPTNQSLSGSTYINPLIIEMDTRLTWDAPPIMNK